MIRFLKIDNQKFKYFLTSDDKLFGIVSFAEKTGEVNQPAVNDLDGFWGREFVKEMFLKYKEINNFPDKGIFAWW